MMTKQQTSLKLQLTTCRQRSVPLEDYPPPQGYEWIPGYLQQYGGQLTPWGRDWLNAKAQEPWVAAVDAAGQEYQDCLDAHASHEPPAAATGLRIQFKTQLKGVRSAPSAPGKGLSARLILSFSPATPPPAPSAPKPVFWISTTAAFDEEALYQAMYSPWGLFSQDRPLSRKGIALDGDATIAALSYEHQFAPAPAGVLLQDDVREALAVAANRLAFAAQFPDGSLAGTWQAVHAPGVSYDFGDYYANGAGGFNWDKIAVNNFADITIRVQASPTLSLSVLNGEGDAIADLTVALSHTGTISSWPVAAVHRLFHNAAQETEIASPPPIDFGPRAIGQSVEVAFSLPEGLAGQVEPDLSISYFDQAGLVSVLAVPAASPGQIGLRLTRRSPFYRMEGRMHLYFKLIPSAHDVRRWPAYARPIRCAVPIVWQQCNAGENQPWDAGRDSGVRIILEAWEATSLTHYDPAAFDNTWEHEVWLRLRDYAAPCDAFDDPANAHYEADVRVTWPDGQTSALHRSSYSSNFDDSMRFVWQTQARNGDPPAFSVTIEFHYFGLNLWRKADDSGYENRPIPGSPALRTQVITPTP